MKKISCFTLVEILAVLAITGILTVGTAVGVNCVLPEKIDRKKLQK